MAAGAEVTGASARGLAAAIADRSVSAVEVMDAHLARVAAWNPHVNAIVTIDEEAARAGARAADAAVARGEDLGPLRGLPFAVKDLEDTAGMRTTHGSRVFAQNVPAADGMLAERLRRAGAVIVGQTNTPEFGAGSQTFNAVFGATRNPYDLSRTAGGSSGGAAAAVATGMVPVADGSDLAASVRNPASFCGVVGLRPSPGRIPDADATSGPWGLARGPRADRAQRRRRGVPAGGAGGARRPRSVVGLCASGCRRARGCFRPARPARGVEPAVDRPPGRAGGHRGPRGRASARLPRSARRSMRPSRTCASPTRSSTSCARCSSSGWRRSSRATRISWQDTVRWNVEKGLALGGAEVARALSLRGAVYAAMRAFMDGYDVLALPTVQVDPFAAEQEWAREIDGVEEWRLLAVAAALEEAFAVGVGPRLPGA